MRKIGYRFLHVFKFIGLSLSGILITVIAITFKHLLDTPQPLESSVPGEAHLYPWHYGHIFYKELGQNNPSPILLIHTPGVGASSHEMRNIMKPLAQMYHVYALDLPGFGLSDRPRLNYTAETYLRLLHDFLTHVVRKPATLLASQYSCAYALAIAQRFPDLCERLILISPQTAPEPGLLSSLAKIPGLGLPLYALLTTRPALNLTLQEHHQEKSSPSDTEYLCATTHRFGAEHAPLAHLSGQLAFPFPEQTGSISQPTLIFLGEYGLGGNHVRMDRDTISAHTQLICIPRVGTFVHEQRPEAVIEHIQAHVLTQERVSIHPEVPIAETAPIQPEIFVAETTPDQKDTIPIEKSLPDRKDTPAEEEILPQEDVPVIEAYCMKCKKKTPMRDPQEVTMKNGRPAVSGTCSACGSGQYRIGKL